MLVDARGDEPRGAFSALMAIAMGFALGWWLRWKGFGCFRGELGDPVNHNSSHTTATNDFCATADPSAILKIISNRIHKMCDLAQYSAGRLGGICCSLEFCAFHFFDPVWRVNAWSFVLVFPVSAGFVPRCYGDPVVIKEAVHMTNHTGNVVCFATRRAAAELARLNGVLGDAQWQSMKEMLEVGGPQAELAASKVFEIQQSIRSLPVGEATGTIRDDALCYLHYQKGDINFYVTEKQFHEGAGELVMCMRVVDGGRNVDFFYARLDAINGFVDGLELDLYWKPMTIAEAKKYG